MTALWLRAIVVGVVLMLLPEVPVLAVLPGSGGISRFTRLVGPHWARWVAMGDCWP